MPTWISLLIGAAGVIGTLIAAWWAQRTSLTNALFMRIAALEARIASQEQAHFDMTVAMEALRRENQEVRQQNFSLRERLQMLESVQKETA